MTSKRSPRIDYMFFFTVMALTAIGGIMVFSASPTMALKLGDSYYYLKRHILYLLLGFSAMYLAVRVSLANIRKWSGLGLLVSIGLLLVLFIPGIGKTIGGATRWIDLIIVSFQPSELIKLTVIIYLANLLGGSRERIKSFALGLMPPLTVIGLVCGLIVLQPDLGTAVAIAGTGFVMIFAAGARIFHLAVIGGFGLAGVIALSISSPYRLRRMVAFLDPWKDPQGTGFHIVQSLLAVGSGGLFGLGLGASRQKFFYLPQQFTDFIFAILCEELGFFGGAGVIVLFVIFAARGFKIAVNTSDRFHALLVTGIISWLTLQALINIMVVLGIMPTTGIPLPFISYGGTATIVSLFAVGLVLNISMQEKKNQ